jgi:hypothetical protein
VGAEGVLPQGASTARPRDGRANQVRFEGILPVGPLSRDRVGVDRFALRRQVYHCDSDVVDLDGSMARADAWTDDEIIIAIATCPRKKQSYSPRHKAVIDLADLIGRTPGAVSLHFANISHLIFGGQHGKTHVSARIRELFAEYRGKDTELRAKAAEIRRRFMAEDPTPRIEKEVPKERAAQLTLDIFNAASESGLPEGSVKTYEREESWHLGVLLDLNLVLAKYTGQATRFLSWLGDHLGGQFSRSRGYELALKGQWQEIAIEAITREAPEFHPKELKPVDRVMLALQLGRIGTLRSWRPTKSRLQSLSNMNREGERSRIREYLNLDAAGICDMCLLMLKDLVERSLKRRRQGS